MGVLSELYAYRVSAVVFGPIAQLEKSIERIRMILFDASLDEEGRKVRLNQSLRDLFDFREMSKLALEKYWKINASRQDEFTEAFAGFLERLYFTHLDKIKDAKIDYLSEETGILQSAVKIEMATRNSLYELDIFMHQINGTWKIYDIDFGGIHLVHNYGQQFMRILKNKSFDELLQMIQKKKNE